MGIVSHNTDEMREWSTNIKEHDNDFNDLINKLYSLIENFAGSEDFRGALSEDLLDHALEQKEEFLRFSDTFQECYKMVNDIASNIDEDEIYLRNKINNQNPLG